MDIIKIDIVSDVAYQNNVIYTYQTMNVELEYNVEHPNT